MRAPFQVNVFPFRADPEGTFEYAVFQRTDVSKIWPGITGGGEDDETPLQATVREAWEEAEIPSTLDFIGLDAIASVPVEWVRGYLWGPDVLLIPRYHSGVDVGVRSGKRVIGAVSSGHHGERVGLRRRPRAAVQAQIYLCRRGLR